MANRQNAPGEPLETPEKGQGVPVYPLGGSESPDYRLPALMARVRQYAIDKGWSDDGIDGKPMRNLGEELFLVAGELVEAFEHWRDGHDVREIFWVYQHDTDDDGNERVRGDLPMKPDGFPVEIADVFIRLFDLCSHRNIPILEALSLKLDYNDSRPFRHGGKLA